MEIDIRASRIDPATGSVGKGGHRGQDLIDLDDKAGLFLEDVHQLTSLIVDHVRRRVGNSQYDPVSRTNQIDLESDKSNLISNMSI